MAGIEGDVWRQEYDRSNDPKREPGPIELNRYMINPVAPGGIPTFMRWPVCLTPEDLKAGEVDVAVIGAPLDLGTGQRGDPFDPVASHEEVRKRVREIAETGVVPFILGGDHSLMRADGMGLADVYGKGNIGVIHFDAHYDAGSNHFGHTITHGTPVRNLIEDGFVKGENFVQVGLRGWFPSEEDQTWMRDQGIKPHYMAEVERDGFTKVMERAIAEAQDGTKYLFISFDIDSLDPAYAPGTGTPEPGGLTTREAFPIVRRLCAECNVVGFELVEVAPGWDPGYTTALNGLRIIQNAITGLAMKKLGITEPWYLDKRTSGRDPVPGQRTD